MKGIIIIMENLWLHNDTENISFHISSFAFASFFVLFFFALSLFRCRDCVSVYLVKLSTINAMPKTETFAGCTHTTLFIYGLSFFLLAFTHSRPPGSLGDVSSFKRSIQFDCSHYFRFDIFFLLSSTLSLPRSHTAQHKIIPKTISINLSELQTTVSDSQQQQQQQHTCTHRQRTEKQ